MIKLNKTLLAWSLICVCFLLLPLYSQVMTSKQLDDYKDKFENAEGALVNACVHLNSLENKQNPIKVAWDDNREELRDQAIQAAAGAVSIGVMSALSPISPSGLVSELKEAMVLAGLTALDISEQGTLDSLLTTAISAVNKKLSEIGDANSGLVKARNDAFEAYRQAYKQYYSPSAEPTRQPQQTVPNVSKYSFSCVGSSSCGNTFDTPEAAISGDFVSCSVEPHSTDGTGWYSCRHSSCPKSDEHYVSCRGGCGQMGKQEWGRIWSTGYSYGPKKGLFNNQLVTIFSHYQKCGVRLSGNGQNYCLSYYYKCNSSNTCSNAENHITEETDDSEQGSNICPECGEPH